MMLVPYFFIFLLIGVNALYVAAEFAAVAVPKSRLHALSKAGNRRASGMLGILEDGARLDDYIAACQIGITLSSLVVGAYAQATLTFRLGPLLGAWFELSRAAALSTAAVAVLLVLTILQVVLGELVPKSLALQFPVRAALGTYLPTRWSLTVYRGFIWLLNGSAAALLKPFGVTPGGQRHVHSPEEIQYLLAASRRGGTLSHEAHRRLQRGLELPQRTARQLMVPRGELHAIEASTPTEDVLRLVLRSPYSRFPVYRDSLDRVIGSVSIKDVAAAFGLKGTGFRVEEIMRPIPFVPEGLPADRLVRFFQDERTSKAVVVDEFGGIEGIISIEDVLGELFGKISDELKGLGENPERLPGGWVRLPAGMGLDEVEAWIGKRWEGKAATVGGLIVEAFGRLPDEGETTSIAGFEVRVEKMSPQAILSVLARPLPENGEEG